MAEQVRLDDLQVVLDRAKPVVDGFEPDVHDLHQMVVLGVDLRVESVELRIDGFDQSPRLSATTLSRSATLVAGIALSWCPQEPAIARPAARPEKMQPPRKVPSSAL